MRQRIPNVINFYLYQVLLPRKNFLEDFFFPEVVFPVDLFWFCMILINEMVVMRGKRMLILQGLNLLILLYVW